MSLSGLDYRAPNFFFKNFSRFKNAPIFASSNKQTSTTMIYDNAAFGIQADGNITNLIAHHDSGKEISSNNVKEFAAAVGVSPARIYEIIRESKEVYPYLQSQRLKKGWFVQVMTKEHADYLYTPII